ncbi:uncharacterized protein LOC114882031 [Osmia bicornis bicornis]|uniref:uncharacterized protein LOC114882031 n=1 Tax=Osmia bicornis bicornis TaxID=1437191 RepID=UPI0010F8B57B|nr:uncharacterized protein LOC114882031 [Osmia bicornis bicornis]
MKFTIFLFTILMCLLVGTLARPDAPIDESNQSSTDEDVSGYKCAYERGKRSAEESSQESNSGNGSYTEVANSLKSISNRVSELLGQIATMSGLPAVKELLSSLPEMLRGNIPLDQVHEMFSTESVDRFLKQLNPLNEMLMNIPWIADMYEYALQMITIPLATIASILATLTTMFGKVMSTISSISPPLLV